MTQVSEDNTFQVNLDADSEQPNLWSRLVPASKLARLRCMSVGVMWRPMMLGHAVFQCPLPESCWLLQLFYFDAAASGSSCGILGHCEQECGLAVEKRARHGEPRGFSSFSSFPDVTTSSKLAKLTFKMPARDPTCVSV